MKKLRGFTLIELLIVVAIIAILAAIAVPNFLEAQVRSKVSRSKADMRSLATAIEAYIVDNNQYPAMATGADGVLELGLGNAPLDSAAYDTAEDLITFAVVPSGTNMQTLTTPVSFITSYPRDPFSPEPDTTFMYINADDRGWILASAGPDILRQLNAYFGSGGSADLTSGPYDWTQETVYNPAVSNPTQALIAESDVTIDGTTSGFTYDTTNGTTSGGDVYRVAGQ